MERTKNINVCFFDSGIGGLTLMSECVRKLPQVDFCYFSDNAHVPYGALDREELIGIVDGIFSGIADINPAAAVIACNTVTAQCIDFLRDKYNFNIIGIQPAVKPAIKECGKCLVLATPATVQSDSFKHLSERYGNGAVTAVACPELAAYIENNIESLNESEIIKFLPKERPESVVLGCTHYVFIKKIIEKYYNCPVFDGISGTSDHLCEILGISDHFSKRAQKITFSGGNIEKNRRIFHELLIESGSKSQL